MKGQLMGHPFIIIFSLIVMGLILLFGFRSISDVSHTADLSELIVFIRNFENTVEVYSNLDIGSSKIVSMRTPKKIEELCFANPGQAANINVEDEFFRSILKDNNEYNLFILPLDAYPTPAPDFTIKDLKVDSKENPLCIKIENGMFKAIIESKTDGGSLFVEIRKK